MGEREPRFIPPPEPQPDKGSPVDMPEDFIDPEGKSGKWGEVVENKELGVRYREKVIELPKHRQEETGIKRIRRREIIDMPAEMRRLDENGKATRYYYLKDDCLPVIRHITDGLFPSDDTCSHILHWQGKGRENAKQRHVSEGLYFQEYYPQPQARYALYRQGPYGGNLECLLDSMRFGTYELEDLKIPEYERKNLISYSYLFVSTKQERNSYLSSGSANPIYIFGSHNQAFRKYLESILTNQLALKLMDKREYPDKPNPEDADSHLGNRNRDTLRKFLAGKVKDIPFGETYIPIIRAPGVPKFRWCDAECALVPTKKSLNVLFFETE